MTSLPSDQKVVLVGHSFGGMSVALAMEKFPQKISVGVFLTAFMPDTIHRPSYVLEKFAEMIPEGYWLDTQFLTYSSKSSEEPLIATLVGPKFLQFLAALTPPEDVELAMTLQRQSSLFVTDLSKAKKFSNEKYGSVRRVFIISKEDKGFDEKFIQLMIENNRVQEVREIRDADHMTMFSQPQLLCDCLIQIAGGSL